MNRFGPSFVVALSLLTASCTSGSVDFSGEQSELLPSTTVPESTATTSTPENLAFSEDEAITTLRVSVPRLDFVDPSTIDETDASLVFVTDLLTDGLTVHDPRRGTAVPGIASSWSTSADGLTWTFELSGATFGDGTPIVAGDVVASLTRVAQQGFGSISGPNLWAVEGWDAAYVSGEVAGIVALDEETVQITLTEQFAPLPDVLAGVAFGIWPAEDSAAAGNSDLPTSSAADFAPTELWADGIRLEIANVHRVEGEISTIELFADPTNSMLQAGETDMSIAVDPNEPLGNLRGTTVQRSADAFFSMNSTVAPFDDPMIRQAIVHAIDRTALRDEFFPHSGVMTGFIPQHVLGGVPDACSDRCEFDPEQATLLVQASSRRDISFTVDYFTEEDASAGQAGPERRLADAIASQLRVVGLNATAEAHTTAEFGGMAARNELGLFRFGSVATAPTAEADIGAMFHTAGTDNLTGTSIERFDDLIDQARQESDPTERGDLYRQAEFVLFGEAVVLPLVEFRHHLAYGPNLAGVSLEADGSLDLSSVEFETVD